MSQSNAAPIRLAEVVAALSLATDVGLGFTFEHGLRTCLVACELARALGLDDAACSEVYYLTLLRYAGCTADAHTMQAIFGDDEVSISKHLVAANPQDVGQIFGVITRHVGTDLPAYRRVPAIASAFVNLMRVGKQGSIRNTRSHCEAARITAERLGFGESMQQTLMQAFELWDGTGEPFGTKGEAIPLSVRIARVAENIYDFHQLGGEGLAIATLRQRSGTMHDPAVVDCFCQQPGNILACLATESAWDNVLTDEPGDFRLIDDADLDAAARAIGDFADLKSFYTVGHSAGVAALAEAAARQCRLPERDCTLLRRAALVHDLGRVGISLNIWDKAGALSRGEWEQVRLHPYYAERVLSRSDALAPLGALAALHHERMDGSGYHRNLPGTMLSLPARLLAAADAYHAMTETRPHRPAMSPDEAAAELRREVQRGKLDAEAANAVLAAAGHRVRATKRSHPAGLSDREVDVLRLIAAGHSNQEMAKILSISKVTVGHHVEHIYNKIGVSTRSAATLFAMQHDIILDPLDAPVG